MASKKDMKREDLIIPYVETEKDPNSNDMSSTLSTTMPMMAMFTRNKMIGWVAMVFSLQTWLAETPESRKNAATPGYLAVGMAFLGLCTSYIQFFLPPPASQAASAAPTS